MSTSDDRMKVLRMIQEGKITPEEGSQLLDLLEEGETETGASAPGITGVPGARGGRWFRVRVTDTHTGKPRANVRLPLGMVNAGIKLGMRFSPEIEGVDINQLTQFIQDGQIGHLVDVEDNQDGERVEISIE